MDIAKPQIITLAEKPINYTVYDGKWIPKSKRFVSIGSHAKGTGALEIYTLNPSEKSGGFECEKTVATETKISLSVATFHASDLNSRNIATADFAGNLQIFDVEKLKALNTWSAVHNAEKKRIVKALVGCGGLNIGEGPQELASGGEDGIVKIWDLRQKGEEVVKLSPTNSETDNVNLPSLPKSSRACWALAFGNAFDQSNRALTAGYDNGDVKMFDLRMLWRKIYKKINFFPADDYFFSIF